MEANVIELRELTKAYGKLKAIDNLSLRIKENEIFGIIGLSGAGKTTLVRLINRLEEADSGEIIINGRAIRAAPNREMREIRKKIGMIFQGFNLLSSRGVKRNIAYPLEISHWKRGDIQARVAELLRLVGLSDKTHARISELSGGQKQRVAIARALAPGPKILLCDEATSALDPQTTKSILNLIRDIQKRYGLTVVLITHQMEVIKEVCHRVALIERGRVVELGTVEQVFDNPESELAREFVSHIRRDDRDYMDFFRYTHAPNAQLVKLHFHPKTAGQPVIYEIIKESAAVISILSGNIFHLTSTNIGELVVEIAGSKKQREETLALIRRKQVRAEILYV